jgi:hypothetical protein
MCLLEFDNVRLLVSVRCVCTCVSFILNDQLTRGTAHTEKQPTLLSTLRPLFCSVCPVVACTLLAWMDYLLPLLLLGTHAGANAAHLPLPWQLYHV